MSKDMAQQTRNAFDFVEKLNFEVSYLFKEIEGLLAMEDEQFQILKPSGYAVTARNSNGLEPVYVEQWLKKSMTVFFCERDQTENKAGTTYTTLQNELKVLFVHVRIIHKETTEPKVIIGVLENIVSKRTENRFEKFAFEFAYNQDRVFNTKNGTHYDDNYCSFEINKKEVDLFDLNNSDDVAEKIVKPLLEIFRGQSSTNV
ncbi:MAG: hypothetical protein SCK57_03745 [Bacillota bacterium]|nr:hypothetical protein [Bacillota bacterium]MDW7676752.1 hypothetical protein [Bacillota bacterium]